VGKNEVAAQQQRILEKSEGKRTKEESIKRGIDKCESNGRKTINWAV
jgi:hypothetical protein